MQDLFATISNSVGGIQPKESLASQFIETSGVITKNLQNFIQIEVLGQLMMVVAENSVDSAKSAILLEIMAHSTGFYKPNKETESAILQDFVKPIIEVLNFKTQSENIMKFSSLRVKLKSSKVMRYF